MSTFKIFVPPLKVMITFLCFHDFSLCLRASAVLLCCVRHGSLRAVWRVVGAGFLSVPGVPRSVVESPQCCVRRSSSVALPFASSHGHSRRLLGYFPTFHISPLVCFLSLPGSPGVFCEPLSCDPILCSGFTLNFT